MPGIITSLALAATLLAPVSQSQATEIEWCAINEETSVVYTCHRTKRLCEDWKGMRARTICVAVQKN